MAQPRVPLGGTYSEPGVRFAQTEPPALLGLFVIPAQELNKEGGKLFAGAFQSFAWEQGTQDRVPANARVKRRGQSLATFFTTKCFQHCATSLHGGDCTPYRYGGAAFNIDSEWIAGDPEGIGLAHSGIERRLV
jgi:hypothetical protein